MARPDDIRPERDQARSDLATERARSAVLTRALEVARGALRAEVGIFAQLMEQKLRENDHKDHWCHDEPSALLRRLREETQELEQAIQPVGLSVPVVGLSVEQVVNIGREAADVANFAMMIADVCGALGAGIASRALTAIDAVTGRGAAQPTQGDDDANEANEANRRTTEAPVRRPGAPPAIDDGIRAGDLRTHVPYVRREDSVLGSNDHLLAAVTGGTPGAGQAPGSCAEPHRFIDYDEDDLCGRCRGTIADPIHVGPATPVAQRRPAKSVPTGKRVVPIKLDPFVQALADRWWDYGEGDDHWGVLVGALSEMLAAAIEARDAEHAAAFEALEEHVACVYASEADLRMELAEAVGADALAAAPEAVSACRQHIDCVAADMAHMNAFGELASHGSLLDQARRAIDAAAPAVVPAETPPMRRCPSCGAPARPSAPRYPNCLRDFAPAPAVTPVPSETLGPTRSQTQEFDPPAAGEKRWGAQKDVSADVAAQVAAYIAPATPPTPSAPPAPVPECLRTLTPEELAKVQPLTDEAIWAALEQGARDKAAAEGRPWPASAPPREGMGPGERKP